MRGRWTVYYGRPLRPNLLLRFASSDWDGDPSGIADEAMTAHVFDREPLALEKRPVADPYIGRRSNGPHGTCPEIPCLGMELNPKRLASTLEWLAQQA